MFYILLLQTMTKRSIKSSGTGTKLALDPILFTPNGIFCKKTLDPSRPGNQPSYTIPNLAAGDGTHALPHCTSILYLPESFWFQSCIKNVIWKAKVEPPTKTWSAGGGGGGQHRFPAFCFTGCVLFGLHSGESNAICCVMSELPALSSPPGTSTALFKLQND
jgi:hypothetical protein